MVYGASQLPVGSVFLLPLVLGVAILAFAALSYQRFRYSLGAQKVEVRKGVLKRSQVSLDYTRVQSVGISRPFYFRPLGLVSLRVDSAGSAEDEVELAALKEDEARDIREFVLARQGAEAVATDLTDSEPAPDDLPHLTRSLGDLVIHGLSNNRIFLVFAALLGVLGQSPLDVEDLVKSQTPGLADSIAQLAGPALLAVIAMALLFALASLLALSVLRTVVTYYGYALWNLGDRFRLRHGLLTEQEVNLDKSRVQSASWEQRWVHRLFGRSDVKFLAVGGGVDEAGVAQAKLLIPAVEQQEALRYSRLWANLPELADATFSPVNWRYAAWRILPLTVGVTILMVALLRAEPSAIRTVFLLTTPTFFLLLSVSIYLSYRRRGVAVIADWVVVRSGLIGVSYRFVPAFKTQLVRLSSTPLMNRSRLCHLQLGLAAQSVRVPFLPRPLAEQIAQFCLFEVEARDRSWM